MDLTQLMPEFCDEWLRAQARYWGVSIAGLPTDAAQMRLNEHISQQRTVGQRAGALDELWRSVPFWLTAGLFLMGELPPRGRREGKRRVSFLQVALLAIGLAIASMGVAAGPWLLVVAALLHCLESFGLARSAGLLLALALLGAIVFWLFPAGLVWIHNRDHRPLGFVSFYVAALICGLAM